MLQDLPSEALFNIASFLSCQDMSLLRLTSKKMCTFCDHPFNWRTIKLEPTENFSLWRLVDLKEIIYLHVSHIHSIQIWSVRDNIIHYLLSQCNNLRHLKIFGWTTLSDHAFSRLSSSSSLMQQPLKLRSLELIGIPQQANYISVDAYTLGGLILRSPDMTHLLFGCDINIHAGILLAELEKAAPTEVAHHLQSFTLATRRTWLSEHVVRLIHLYPSIQQVYLLSIAAAEELHLKYHQRPEEVFDASRIVAERLKLAQQVVPPSMDCQYPLIATENMIVYNKNLLSV